MREKVRRSCTIFFTRCVPSRLRASSLPIVSRMRSVSASVRWPSTSFWMYSSSSWRFAWTKPIGLLSSWATPATSWPSDFIFSACVSWAWISRSSRVRSSTRASSVSLSFAISSKALAFSIAIELWFASVRSSRRSSAASRSPESLRPTAITPSRSTP